MKEIENLSNEIKNKLMDSKKVDFKDRDEVFLSDINNIPKERPDLYRDKPLGFKYEKSDRTFSLMPLEVQSALIALENEKVFSEQQKLTPNSSINYESKKTIDEKKLFLNNYNENVDNIIDKINKIVNSEDLTVEEKKLTMETIVEDLNSEFSNSSKSLKLRNIKQVENQLDHKIEVSNLRHDINTSKLKSGFNESKMSPVANVSKLGKI